MTLTLSLLATSPPGSSAALGAFFQSNGDQNHVGLLFSISPILAESNLAAGWYLLDLAWHHWIRCRPPSKATHEAISWLPSGLQDDDDQQLVIGLCKRIACLLKEHGKLQIPYGLSLDGDGIDPTTGEWRNGPEGPGRTCATFVMEVFKSLDLPLLDNTTWETRSDDATWQTHILDYLEHECDPPPSAAYLALQRAHIGKVVRFRPEEVAAGVGSPNIPPSGLSFSQAQTLGPMLVRQYQDLLSPKPPHSAAELESPLPKPLHSAAELESPLPKPPHSAAELDSSLPKPPHSAAE